jgi:SanA protein
MKTIQIFFRNRWVRRALLCGGAAACAGMLAVFWAWHSIHKEASRVHDVAHAPRKQVALVLGCSPMTGDRNNSYFENRIECAAQLFKAGRVEYLLVSGDNSRSGYDEPTAMKDALVARGVPTGKIYLDYAGFSTLDSVVRANRVVGQKDLLIVSQRDHVMRALYIADAHGIAASGVSARGVPLRAGLKVLVREALARVRTVLDVGILGRKPRFLGPPVPIPGTQVCPVHPQQPARDQAAGCLAAR